MSSSCDTAPRATRVLRGASAPAAAFAELPAFEPRRTPGAPPDPAAAEARVEAEMRAGFEAGYAEGLQEAHRQAAADRAAVAARAAVLLDELARAVQDLHARTAAEIGAVEDAIVDGALALAEAVLGREADEARHARDAVARALALAPRNLDVAVHVHPADAGLLDAATLPPGVTVVADPTVDRGGCLAEVGDCTIDARLGAALDRAREALR